MSDAENPVQTTIPAPIVIPFGSALEEVERQCIIRTYKETNSVMKTAALLQISIRKVHYRIKQYRAAGLMPARTTVKEEAVTNG